jgi:uncharacterized protein YhbP (UPF0306 family)
MESLNAVYEILAAASTMTLATTDGAGAVHATPVYYAVVCLDAAPAFWKFCFFSNQSSLHVHQMESSPLVAAAIYPESWLWQDIRGLQLRGWVAAIDADDEWELAWQAYCLRFPFVVEMKSIVSQNTFYYLKLEWMRLLDNRQGFGFKQEWHFSEIGQACTTRQK